MLACLGPRFGSPRSGDLYDVEQPENYDDKDERFHILLPASIFLLIAHPLHCPAPGSEQGLHHRQVILVRGGQEFLIKVFGNLELALVCQALEEHDQVQPHESEVLLIRGLVLERANAPDEPLGIEGAKVGVEKERRHQFPPPDHHFEEFPGGHSCLRCGVWLHWSPKRILSRFCLSLFVGPACGLQRPATLLVATHGAGFGASAMLMKTI